MSDYLKDLEMKAENGDLEAQKYMASNYEIGLEVEASPEKALYWWAKASRQNDEHAFTNLINLLGRFPELYESSDIDDELRSKIDSSPIESLNDVVLMAQVKVTKGSRNSVPKILLIDKNSDSLKMMKFQVERNGWKCLEAMDMKSAAKICTNENVCGIIFDLITLGQPIEKPILKLCAVLSKRDMKPQCYLTAKTLSREDLLALKNAQIAGVFLRPYDDDKIAKTLDTLKRTLIASKKIGRAS